MRSLILMGCLWVLAFAAQAQGSGRIAPGTPLRWGMDGSIEVMPGDLARHYGSNDTANAFRRNSMAPATTVLSNPHANRIATVQAQCQNNAMSVSWVAIQQGGADRYEVEQSTDGRNWRVVGVVPANRSDFGEASYNFQYNRDASNVLFRIAATSTGGERTFSAPFHSPCSNESYLAVTPNPVYSTTTARIGSPSSARVKLMLLNASGMPLYSTDAQLVQGINHLPIDMSRFAPGAYNVVIRWTSGRQVVLPLMKQ